MEKGGDQGSRLTREPAGHAAKMQKGADGSRIAREPGRAAEGIENTTPPSGGSSAPPPQQKKDWTPEEHKAASEFIREFLVVYNAYDAMSADDVEEEYRRAGKLHMYDPDTELKKRYARVGKKHPPPPGYFPSLDDCLKLIQDEED